MTITIARSEMPKSVNRSIPERVARRAFDGWEVSPSGCYISTYSVASHGYAQIGWRRDQSITGTTAHRAAWVHANGQIPAGMTIDHLCKNRRCVNVEHLRMLSNFENARRTDGRDWPLGECANGHPNTELVEGADGAVCRPCRNEWNRSWRFRNRDRFNAQQREYRRGKAS